MNYLFIYLRITSGLRKEETEDKLKESDREGDVHVCAGARAYVSFSFLIYQDPHYLLYSVYCSLQYFIANVSVARLHKYLLHSPT